MCVTPGASTALIWLSQPRLQVLVDNGRPAGKPDVPSPGGILGVRKR
jgi:hypothetical protein